MRSIALSRIFFGCIRISLIGVALLFGTMLLVVTGAAQQIRLRREPMLESLGMAEHKGTPTSLRELVQEAEEKNPEIAASFHAWQASRNVPKQVSALLRHSCRCSSSALVALDPSQVTATVNSPISDSERPRIFRIRESVNCAAVSPNTSRTRWKHRPIWPVEPS